MAVRFQGGQAIPTSANSAASAKNASARLSNLASAVDEVARTLKRDSAGEPKLQALASEVDALRQQIANVSKKLSAYR